jgi:hypothetical protein
VKGKKEVKDCDEEIRKVLSLTVEVDKGASIKILSSKLEGIMINKKRVRICKVEGAYKR